MRRILDGHSIYLTASAGEYRQHPAQHARIARQHVCVLISLLMKKSAHVQNCGPQTIIKLRRIRKYNAGQLGKLPSPSKVVGRQVARSYCIWKGVKGRDKRRPSVRKDVVVCGGAK